MTISRIQFVKLATDRDVPLASYITRQGLKKRLRNGWTVYQLPSKTLIWHFGHMWGATAQQVRDNVEGLSVFIAPMDACNGYIPVTCITYTPWLIDDVVRKRSVKVLLYQEVAKRCISALNATCIPDFPLELVESASNSDTEGDVSEPEDWPMCVTCCEFRAEFRWKGCFHKNNPAILCLRCRNTWLVKCQGTNKVMDKRKVKSKCFFCRVESALISHRKAVSS